MKASESTAKLIEALFQFQTIVEKPKKDGYNPHFNSKYATLESVMNAVGPALRETGLLMIQDPVREGNAIGVKIRIIHKASGEWIEFDPVMVAAGKQDGHGVGSALTYARRYAISTAFGLATEDDDGNAAANPQTKQQAQRRQQQVKQEEQQLAQELTQQRKQAQNGNSNRYARLFAVAREKGISNKAMKGLCFYYFNKASRTELTGEELNQFANILQTASPDQIKADLKAAVQVYQSRNNVVPMQQKGQMAPLTAEEVDQVLGLK